jgi:hypothetical protein
MFCVWIGLRREARGAQTWWRLEWMPVRAEQLFAPRTSGSFLSPFTDPVAISCGTWDHDAFDQRELPIDLPACEEISHFYA